ncbi:putative transcriptional regulatory protein [Colletotrichum spinosum]|uniref:Putative transcriptional regulatory protein n=1 Tax=Colletotrichum spinosum TaxID=1347390 RepID=A0A4R8PP27_9PEZI|nr:putative transcriptional regulatory protein [Colletotrichum spinosum]
MPQEYDAMAAAQTLRLEPVTVDDVPSLTQVWFAAFTDPDLRRLWPDTPGVRKWWDDANRHDILNKPFQRYVKVVDTASADTTGRARIAAFAKWDLSMPDQRGRRYPPWCDDMPRDVCDEFIQREEAERKRVMGDEKHYYLDTVATHPDYQRRGAGSMLVKWGCERADEDGVGAYVDASKAGAPLYQRHGFVDESKPDSGDIASMARNVKCSGGPEPCDNCHRLRLGCTFNYPESVTSSEPGDPHGLLAPTEALTEAGTKRRRIAAACVECRAQKAKCSGHRPQCFHCNRRNLTCVYPSSTTRRKGRAPPSQSHQSASPESTSTLSQGASHENESTSQQQQQQQQRTANPAAASLNTALDRSLLSTDVIRQHLEAFFDHVYPLGLDFFHRPSMMEEFYAGKLPPILCTSICATAAMFVSRSREARVLSVSWAKDVDAYIFGNLNVYKVLNIQLMSLSMFQNFAYRQFGKVWLLVSTAARLCVAFQLNDDRPLAPDADTASMIRRECERRLVWHVWWMDKGLSAGFDEFTCLPNRWMRTPLPNPEHTFRYGLLKKTSKLGDGVEALAAHDAGARASTKAIVLGSRSDSSPAAVSRAVATLTDLKDKLADFRTRTPTHIQPTELNMFSHSTTPEFSAYITLNSWYLQTCCDLFRTCLPGFARESAAASFIAEAPPGFVSSWRSLAVSHALRMARLWEHLQALRSKGALHSKQTRLPIGLGYGNMVHQCTKTLLTARRHELYENLVDPINGAPVELTDDIVDELCKSNVGLLDDMSGIAPITAVLQEDVKKMIESDKLSRQDTSNHCEENADQMAPISSEVQRATLLSRYHPLSQSFDTNPKTVDEIAIQHSDSPQLPNRTLPTSDTEPTTTTTTTREYQMQAPSDIYNSSTAHTMNLGELDGVDSSGGGGGLDDGGPLSWSGFAENQLVQDYYVAPSQFDMSGELSWFLSSYLDPDPINGSGVRSSEPAP